MKDRMYLVTVVLKKDAILTREEQIEMQDRLGNVFEGHPKIQQVEIRQLDSVPVIYGDQ